MASIYPGCITAYLTSRGNIVQIIQGGVPINMGVKKRILYRLCSMRDYFVNIILQYPSWNILHRKLLVLGFPKCGLPFLCLQYWRRYWEFCPDSSLLKINRTVHVLRYKDTKKVDHMLEISLDFQSFFEVLYVIY